MSATHWVIQLVQTSQARQNSQYLPYASGLLQAYTLQHASDVGRYAFLPILFERLPLQAALRQCQIADVLALSTYVWNIEYALRLAQAHKARKPQALTIFGGPQVPDHAEVWLRANPQVDVCCHGPGEATFLALLERLPTRDWNGIPGISWLDAAGVFHHAPQAPRRANLDEIPSPYLMGLMDPYLKAHPDYQWAALWETNRGCPFSCTFCDWGSATQSKVYRFEMERLEQEMRWFARQRIAIVNCCDANFGIFPRDLEITDRMVALNQQSGYPQIFFIQGAKNVTERAYEIHKKVIQAGLNELVTLSLQSVSEPTLAAIKRQNISLASYRELQQRFQREGINTYSDMLIGLPGETFTSFADGIDQVIREGQHHLIQFFNVYILPNAEMAQPAYRAQYGIQTVRTPYFEPWFPLSMEIPEYQEMIIATDSYSQADWRHMRTLAWWVEILYLQRKLVQLPLLLIHLLTGLSYREMFAFYQTGEFHGAGLLSDLRAFLERQALAIQQGNTELCALQKGAQSVWLTVSDYVITGLYTPAVTRAFFADQLTVLRQLLAQTGHSLPPGLLEEALTLSEQLFISFAQQKAVAVNCRYNLWDLREDYLQGRPWALETGSFRYLHDWPGRPFFSLRRDDAPKPVGRLLPGMNPP